MKVQGYAYQRVTVELGYSEVLVHLRKAGRREKVDVLPNGVQLLDGDNEPFSFPITHTEAGIEYMGVPRAIDHAEHAVSIQFDNTWHCYTCEIYNAQG